MIKRNYFIRAYIAFLLILLFAGVYTMNAMRLGSGLAFEDYFATGTPEQRQRQTERIAQTNVSGEFIRAVQKIRTPAVVVAVSSMGCPDCVAVTPFLLAMEKENVNIDVKFFKLTRVQKNRLLLRTRQTYIPTVFIATPKGKLYSGNFVERPLLVKELTKNAKSEDEKKQIVQDFRSGKYNAEIEKDLLKLIDPAIQQQ